MKRLLIIPARLGSKRIKEKNIKKFFGKPIIYYSIQLALKSGLFNKIHVSTESKKIKNIVEKFGLKIDFLRNKKFSTDRVKLIDVFRYVVKKFKLLGESFDQIWFISSCAPLLNKKDLIKASKLFLKKNVTSFIAVSEFAAPIQQGFKIDKRNKLKSLYPNKINSRTQDLEKYYFDVGQLGGFRTSELFKKKINFSAFIIDKDKSIDVDELSDWKLMQILYKCKNYNEK